MRDFDTAIVANLHISRIRQWRAPPNWSSHDWREEINAIEAAAKWQAILDFDSSLGVPLEAFVRQRILTDALTRYRQEWNHALHCVTEDGSIASSVTADPGTPDDASHLTLTLAIACLTAEEQWLLEELVNLDTPQAVVGEVLGIGQRAVSKRQNGLLERLRSILEKK